MSFNHALFQKEILQLPWENAPLHFKIQAFEELASTNQTAWELLDQGQKPPFGVVATQQSAGKGQWGRTWRSHPGGLYLSLALESSTLLDPPLTLAIAHGIAIALRRYKIPVLLKWPNDLILQGQKLGGIKTEIRTQGTQKSLVVIGVGINWQNPVPDHAINLTAYPQIQHREQLAALTVNGVISGYQQYCQEKLTKLLPSYEKLLITQGQTVRIQRNSGKVVGVTPKGELRVRLSAAGATTEITYPVGTLSLGSGILEAPSLDSQQRIK